MDGAKQSRLRRRLLLGALALAIGAEVSFVMFNHYSTEKALKEYLTDHGWKLEWRKAYPARRDWVLLDRTGQGYAHLSVSPHSTTVGACSKFRERRSVERVMTFLAAPVIGDESRVFTAAGWPSYGNLKVCYISFRSGRFLVEVRSNYLPFEEVAEIAKRVDEMVGETVPFRFFGYPIKGGFIEQLILKTSISPVLPFR